MYKKQKTQNQFIAQNVSKLYLCELLYLFLLAFLLKWDFGQVVWKITYWAHTGLSLPLWILHKKWAASPISNNISCKIPNISKQLRNFLFKMRYMWEISWYLNGTSSILVGFCGKSFDPLWHCPFCCSFDLSMSRAYTNTS